MNSFYTIQRDTAEETYQFDVLDSDGDILDSFEKLSEAKQDARERTAADRAERDEEEAVELRALIAERLEDLSLTALKAVAASLGM